MNTNPSREGLIARWRKTLGERRDPAGSLAKSRPAELAPFQERLDRLRELAEAGPGPQYYSSYEQLWHTMGKELDFLADSHTRGQISTTTLNDALVRWTELGLGYLEPEQDHTAAREILAAGLPDEATSGRVQLGGGAVVLLPWAAPVDAATGETAVPADVMQRLGDLLGRADHAEMNAERAEDADQSAHAEQLRQTAEQLRREATELARDAGLSDPFDDDIDDDIEDRARADLDAEHADALRNDPHAYYAEVARRVDWLAAEVEAAGDVEDARNLRILARQTRHTPSDWDGESVIDVEPWQIEARARAEAELKATGREIFPASDHEVTAVEDDASDSTDHAEDAAQTAYPSGTTGTWTVWDHTNDREIHSGISEAEAREMVTRDPTTICQIDDGHEAADDTTDRNDIARVDAADEPEVDDDLRSQVDSVACTAAIRRAEVSVAQIREQAGTAAAEAERDNELERWHADDTAASVQDRQAMDTCSAGFGDSLTDG